MNLLHQNTSSISLFQTRSLAIGLVMAVVSAACAFLTPQLFFPAYLVAYLFFWSIAIGCLALSCLHHVTGGGWGIAIRRSVETGASTLPLLALLFVPILFGLPVLYEWARPAAVSADAALRAKAAYLNVDFFEIRALIYFAIWILLTWMTNRASARCDLQPTVQRRESLAFLSAIGLILWALTVTFAAIDWAMSLNPHWVSGIYGVIFMAGQAVSSTAFVIVVVAMLRSYDPIARVISESRLHDLGNFLMAYVLFWTYTSFTQYLVIWSGNLPEEASWYLVRGRGGWQILMMLLVGLHFIVPFVLLLNRPVKRNPRYLATVATLLLVMRFADLYWQVMPTFSPAGFQFNWVVLITVPAIGGLWLAAFLPRLPEFASIAVEDAQGKEAVHHAHA